MRAQQAAQLRLRLEEAATDVGRLRRRVINEVDVWTLDRIGSHLEAAHLIVSPTAGELVACTAPGDRYAITEAIAIVDSQAALFRAQLGVKA